MAEATATFFLERFTNWIAEEINLLMGVREQVSMLENDLKWLSSSIEKAEQKRRSDKSVKLWVQEARDVTFHAEDVIDEFIFKIIHQPWLKKESGPINRWLQNSISYPQQLPLVHELANQIKEINTRVVRLLEMERHLHETAQIAGGGIESSKQHKIKLRRAAIAEEEYPNGVNSVKLHEDSRKQVTRSLLRGDKDKKLCYISIIGMGGVGKTTLAKNIYNDDDVKRHFVRRAFVYVSQSYSLGHLFKSIKRCFVSDMGDAEVSQQNLRDYLQGKKYLIVLDDIWSTEDLDRIRSAFPDDDNGSRILLTTRLKQVALSAGALSIHELGVINAKESWELFVNKMFPSGTGRVYNWGALEKIFRLYKWVKKIFPLQLAGTHLRHPLVPLPLSSASQPSMCPQDLEDLGKQMVEKCRGLPLAIVVLGSLLSSRERSQAVWSRVNDGASWYSCQDDEESYKCSGILALSYHDLPSKLKLCFLYMSLFPKGSEIRATKLFQYWIAEGFAETKENLTAEADAEEHLDKLINRNMIQVGRLRCDGRVKTCHIHDLLRDISVAESNEDQFSQIYGNIDEFYLNPKSFRRVAVYSGRDTQNKEHLSEFPYTQIRSLICQDVRFKEGNYLSLLFRGFKLLRVLDFNGFSEGFVSLPKELGELVHLRYLSLEKTRLEKINTSYFRKLVSLQTLNLNECIDELLLDDQIWSLQDLRHLYLGSIKPAANNNLTTVPVNCYGTDSTCCCCWGNINMSTTTTTTTTTTSTTSSESLGIGKLTNLQSLSIQDGDWLSGGLERLSSLKKLRIDKCSHSGLISKVIGKLEHLQSLELLSEEAPIKSIQPSSHTRLKKLHLKGDISEWAGSVSFPLKLCKLILVSSCIKEDPMSILEKLPNLTFLHLGFNAYAGSQMVCSRGGFARLQVLQLYSLEKLEELIVEVTALESLTSFSIEKCGQLVMIPDGVQQLTTLEELRVANMPVHFRRRIKEDGDDWNKIKHIPSLTVVGF
ncbi:hypothetical protein MKW92_022701 [Papaver armeniacum]|nr:hypothetical protein MKW92_022701 [Papaver armeniacum]